MGKHAIDHVLRLQNVLEDGQALRAVEVGRLARHDLHAGAFRAHVSVEALAAITGRRRSGDAFQLHDLALAAKRVAEELRRHAATGHVIGSDVAHHLATGCATVNGEDRDARVIGGQDGGHNRVRVGRVDQNGIHALRDQVFHVGRFGRRVILRIQHDQLNAHVVSNCLRTIAQRDKEGVVQGRQRQADGVSVFLCADRRQRQNRQQSCKQY